MLRKWFGIALGFFMLVAIEGLMIRWLPFQNFIDSVNHYKILQSHSHTSFLGWVIISLFVFIIFEYKIDLFRTKAGTNILFFILVLIVCISAISFVMSGYSIISIVSLVMFLLVSYYGFYKVFKSFGIESKKAKFRVSVFYIKAAIVFYFISSISTWVLPVLIITSLKKSPFYFYNIYFYLHFLINGFITFTILSFFLKNLNITQKYGVEKKVNISFIFLIIGTVLTYSGSLLWNKVPLLFNFVNFLGAFIIFIPIIFLTRFVSEYLRSALFPEKILFNIAWISLIIKVCMQMSQSLPILAETSYLLKGQLIVGYMHLVTLGFISSFIISYAFRTGIFVNSFFNILSTVLFVISVLLTEITLFSHGILMTFGIYFLSPYFNILMLIFTIPLSVSIVLFLISFISINLSKKKKQINKMIE